MKVILKNKSLSYCWWRTGPNIIGCLSQLEMKIIMAKRKEKIMTAHFVHHESHFLTWWLLTEAAWPYKNNQVVNVPALPQLQDVKLLLSILLETVQLHLDYSVWGKMSPSAQTFSMYTFKRIFGLLQRLMAILCFMDVPTASNQYWRFKPGNWISLGLRVYLGNVKQLLNRIASPKVCIPQSLFTLEARRQDMHRLCIFLVSVVCIDNHTDSKLLDIAYRISLRILKKRILKNSVLAKM